MELLVGTLLSFVIPAFLVTVAAWIGWMARGSHDSRTRKRARRDAVRRGQPLPPRDADAQSSHVRVAQFK